MWVKICGNTNLEDAKLAIELGADAVGFVFAASKRQVTTSQVAAITSHLPTGVERVGVFDSHDAEQIAQTALDSGLTTVQLHGGSDEALVRDLGEKLAGRVRIIQTLHWTVADQASSATPGTEPESSAAQLMGKIERVGLLGIADRILVDSKVGAASGGTGVAFDWTKAQPAFATPPGGVRLILAGGLKPDNVGEAVGELSPWGVDVCSGVEASPGRKDPKRLAQFIENARRIAAR
jgi:phosphoribosylanthranilate isomerase